MKFGGTSVADIDRIRNVARHVKREVDAGHEVAVVVSAMSGETNRLIALAKEVQAQPDPRELDVMVSTGEQVTIGLLAMALKEIGLGDAGANEIQDVVTCPGAYSCNLALTKSMNDPLLGARPTSPSYCGMTAVSFSLR